MQVINQKADGINTATGHRGLLGDTAARDYAQKLQLFNAFAEPELRQAIGSLKLKPDMRILDAGCGTGEALGWLADAVGTDGWVAGFDLAGAHVSQARTTAPSETCVLQADLLQAPFVPASFDLVWCSNTLHHLLEPLRGVKALINLLRPGGRVALGQSSLVPEMCFAWDARLERTVLKAVRRYYQNRYEVSETDLAGIRRLVGLMRLAGLHNVTAKTLMIERVSPVNPADERYLLEAIFRHTWGERLRPYLSSDDYEELARLCDPDHPGYALHRADFHFLQSFTLVTGQID